MNNSGVIEWFPKPTNYEGKDAFIAITLEDGGGIPETLDEPILVGIYDMETMDIIVDAKRVDSLKSYLETIQETE